MTVTLNLILEKIWKKICQNLEITYHLKANTCKPTKEMTSYIKDNIKNPIKSRVKGLQITSKIWKKIQNLSETAIHQSPQRQCLRNT